MSVLLNSLTLFTIALVLVLPSVSFQLQQYTCCAIGSKDRSLSIWVCISTCYVFIVDDCIDDSANTNSKLLNICVVFCVKQNESS